MSSIFQVGDIVHNNLHKEGTVLLVEPNIHVMYKDGVGELCYSKDVAKKILSFSAWPSPDHVRPFEEGMYKVMYKGSPWVLGYRNRLWHFVDTSYRYDTLSVTREKVESQHLVDNVEFLYSFP